MNRGLRIGSGPSLGGLGAFGIKGSGAGDVTSPTVIISSSQSSPTAAIPIPLIFTFSENVSGFTLSDISIVNGSGTNFAGSNLLYTCDAYPSPNATMTVNVAAGVCVDGAGNGNLAATQFSIVSNAYAFADEFTDTVAAGFVSGTTATPTGQLRGVIDTNGKLSIGSGLANFATGGAGAFNPVMFYPQVVRAAGKVMVAQVGHVDGAERFEFDTSAASTTDGIQLNDTVLSVFSNGSGETVGSISKNATYKLALVQRSAGFFAFIKGGAFTFWTLLKMPLLLSSNQYPGLAVINTTTTCNFAFIRIPASTVTITPIASDAFTRTNGSLGNTGGGGSEEAGGSGLIWSNQVGTWGISSNSAVCSALSTGTALATVPCGTTNAVIEAAITRTTGSAGIVARFVDTDNYLAAYHDGTNIHLDSVVSGTVSSLINTAIAYSAGKRVMLVLNNTKARLFYNEQAKGTEQTISDPILNSGQAFGLYTNITGSSVDNFVVWARGIGEEYENILNKYVNP